MTILRRPGFRFVVEALAILLAALIAGMRDVGWPGIIAAVAVVWVIAALTEYALSRPRRSMPAHAPAGEREPEPEPEPMPQPMPPREPEPVPYAVPIAVAAARAPEEDTAPPPQVPAAPPEEHTAPAPEALAPPQVREAEPEPEPEPAPEPQRWNIWDLERSVRDNGEVSEEQEFLLLYLRDYADPDGLLPLDFDNLVRESFGEALVAAGVVAGAVTG